MIKMLLFIFLISGCASLNPRGEAIKTDTGVIFIMNTQGKLAYKDSDIEAEMDTRSPSLLRTLVEGVVIQGIKTDR